jgi:hypothetical protein
MDDISHPDRVDVDDLEAAIRDGRDACHEVSDAALPVRLLGRSFAKHHRSYFSFYSPISSSMIESLSCIISMYSILTHDNSNNYTINEIFGNGVKG